MRTLLFGVVLASLFSSASALAEDSPQDAALAAKLEAAKKRLATQEYKLRYRFAPGEVVRWKVIHLVTVETKIQGVTQTAKTRSVSTKAWKILDADLDGKIRLQHLVESVDMWQGVSGRSDVRYNSASDENPPEEYAHVKKSIGVPLATVTIDLAGRVLERKNELPQFNPGLGELTVPLPEGPVKIGSQWEVPEELNLRLQEGQVKKVKTRQLYTLEAVETGVATIKVETQVLTPVDDPKVKVMLIQRLTSGTIKFDLDAGRIMTKQMDLDELVLGFKGNDSSMAYRARFTEELLKEDPETARKPTIGPANSSTDSTTDSKPAATVKERDGKPALRR